MCLPAEDAGGLGPKVESWAFATDQEGLAVLADAGVFNLRTCKLCSDGIVVMGEYGVTNILMSRGFNVATLMAKYGRGVDWRERSNWGCNDNVHPSRHGTYDGLTMHPFETVFIKASWNVGEPFTSRYTAWFLGFAAGRNNTEGTFNRALYRYAISPEAQEPQDVGRCYKVLQ